MNYIFYDVVIAALLLFFLWRGYRKGLILTLCGFLAVFVALIGASILSNVLAEPVAKAIEPVVESGLHDSVLSATQAAPSAEGADPFADLPLEELLEAMKSTPLYQGFADAFQKALDAGAAEVAGNAARAVAHFVAVQIARTVIFSVAFIAVLIAWSVLSHALDLVAKLPVLNSLNRWTGAVLGLAEGALLVFIAAWLLKDSYLPPEAVQNTYLLPLFCTANPLKFLP